MATVKINLKVLMEKKGRELGLGGAMTQRQLAEDLNIAETTISRWVGNKVDRVDLVFLAVMCKYFDCEVGELLVMEE